jgi:hypothetical protein
MQHAAPAFVRVTGFLRFFDNRMIPGGLFTYLLYFDAQ